MRVAAYMTHGGQASAEGRPYRGWIQHEVGTTHRLTVIHCQAIGAIGEAAGTPTFITAALDALHGRYEVNEYSKTRHRMKRHVHLIFQAV